MLLTFTFTLLVISNLLVLIQKTDSRRHHYSNVMNEALIRHKILDSSPQQIHMAIGDKLSEMVFIWSTKYYTNKSEVQYGFSEGKYNHKASGHSILLKNNDKEQYIHYVTIKNLKPNRKYKYRVGSAQSWSREYSFKTLRQNNKWVPRVAIFGDMGWIKGYSIPSLIDKTKKNAFEMAIHIGDIAYELYTFSGTLGDGFLNAIQPIAANIPYMVVPGNHEYFYEREGDLGYNYHNRFKMPGNSQNEFYTFKLGKALFVAFSTEYYFKEENGSSVKVALQKQWLESVLTEANQPKNRAEQPWIIALGHRSLYCSTTDPDCIDGMTTDTGDTNTKMLELEEILHRQGVDVAFWGHYHYYDRFLPVYNRTTSNSSNPYFNPFSTVHIISGSAGLDGDPEEFVEPPPRWSAFRTKAYGYTILKVVNTTHLYLEQIDISSSSGPIDSVWIVQQNHGKRDLPLNNKI